jgi:glycosyltransferase involved in cell wall biosynthesis
MPKEQSKVLVVGGFPHSNAKVFGGIVTSCRVLLESSFPNRFDLVLVNTTQITNPPPHFIIRLILSVKRLIIYVYLLISKKPDAVLLFTSKGFSLVEKGFMAWVARVCGVPSLMFPRGGALINDAKSSVYQRFWIRLALNGSNIFLCQGPSWIDFATKDLGFPRSRVILVPNWTASSNLLRIGENRSSCHASTKLQILFLGWLEREKGIFELLDACAQISSNFEFTLTIAGRGEAELSARDHVKEKKLLDHVHFAGWVEGRELEQMLAKSDIFVLPSWSEGLPNAMIEAMAARLAVVVSSVGNIPHVITDGKEALLVPPKNALAIRIALEKLLEHSEFRESLAQRGHEFVRQNYSVEPAIEKLSLAISSLISDHNCH